MPLRFTQTDAEAPEATSHAQRSAANLHRNPASDLPEILRNRLQFLKAVCEPQTAAGELRHVRALAWHRQCKWLDTSGLTLPLYRVLCESGLGSLAPSDVQQRWATNLAQNAKRMGALADEMDCIHRGFQSQGVRYATLKGFSLFPVSVPHLEDRSQLDLDFLVAGESVAAARAYLESRGYHLRAISGRSLEFKTNEPGATSLKDLYKAMPFRCVELHVEAASSACPLLPHVHWQPWRDLQMPVLHAAHLFVGQGRHLYKHIVSEFFRLAHLVEFRRHVIHRFSDDAFWRDVRHAAADDPATATGLGVAIELTTALTGSFAPEALTSWTTGVLPSGAWRWIQHYGVQAGLSSFPGSKLYLILQRELSVDARPAQRTVLQALVPRRLPPQIAYPHPGESKGARLWRYFRQLRFIMFRLRFHLLEGVRYWQVSRRWYGVRGFLLCVFFLACCTTSAQQDSRSPLLYSPSAEPPQQTAPTPTNATPSPNPAMRSSDLAATPLGTTTPLDPALLTADEIRSTLQQNPEAMVEVKQLMSDNASRSGQPLPVDSITDEMLMARINDDPVLRSNITLFLRTRGYVPEVSTDPSNLGYTDADVHQTPGVARRDQTKRAAVAAGQDTSAKEPKVLHRAAPYNLLALHDLYTQVQDTNGPLRRFGSDVFQRRDAETVRAMSNAINLEAQPGETYLLGPGDTLSIQMWGGVSQSLVRTITREGQIMLPEAGALTISGMNLQAAEQVIVEALRRQFRNAQATVTIARLRGIRVYVVGDVQRPGAYEMSALATPVSALYAAGGPTAIGSLRLLRHYRGPRLVGEIDLYDFLLRGVQSEDRLQSGDTLLVPPVGAQVSVSGAVKRPAIYELKSKTSLQELLEDAGAARVTAALGHITIDRVQPNRGRETVPVDVPADATAEQAIAALSSFAVQDGDWVRISPIEAYSERVVYTEGHLLRPGRMPYRDGMTLNAVLKSYRDLLPEPADRGEIVRLMSPDLHVEVIAFSVDDLMIGNSNIALQPFDTVRVYGRYEADAPKVTINGEVLRPGTYSLSKGMTAAQLVRLAGGFTRAALLTDADLTSYRIVNGTRVEDERTTLSIGEAVARESSAADVALKAGDTLNVHRLAGWDDVGASIQLDGEVSHAGRYGVTPGERLSSVLLRAGGFRDSSYPAGAVLTRPEVQSLEEKSKEELIRQIEVSSSAARIAPSLAPGDSAVQLQLVQAQQQQVLENLKSKPTTGRLVLHISGDIASWANTPADIEVRAGDVLRIPKRPGFVLVNGQVYNTSAITYAPGKSAGWYLRRAGGPTQVANTKEIFVIRANGSVVGRATGVFFHRDVLSTRLDPGDVVVVPQKIIGGSLFWRNLLTVAQITSSIAITAAVAGAL